MNYLKRVFRQLISRVNFVLTGSYAALYTHRIKSPRVFGLAGTDVDSMNTNIERFLHSLGRVGDSTYFTALVIDVYDRAPCNVVKLIANSYPVVYHERVMARSVLTPNARVATILETVDREVARFANTKLDVLILRGLTPLFEDVGIVHIEAEKILQDYANKHDLLLGIGLVTPAETASKTLDLFKFTTFFAEIDSAKTISLC